MATYGRSVGPDQSVPPRVRPLVALSLPCFWIEWHRHGTLVVPTVIGLNLIFARLRLVYRGKGGSERL